MTTRHSLLPSVRVPVLSLQPEPLHGADLEEAMSEPTEEELRAQRERKRMAKFKETAERIAARRKCPPPLIAGREEDDSD